MSKIRFAFKLLFLIVLLFSLSYSDDNNENEIKEISDEMLSTSQARIILFKSLVVPGWGEHSLGNRKRGYAFNSSDITLWLLYAALKYYSDAEYSNMEAYAATHAGINPSDKDNIYYTDIGNYLNIYDYNNQKLRYRQTMKIYPENDNYFWSWDSDESRKEFDKKRLRTLTIRQNASFVLSGLIVNRIISAIDIISLTKDRVNRPDREWAAIVSPGLDRISLSLNFSF